MKTRTLASLLLLVTLLLSCKNGVENKEDKKEDVSKPNILFVFIDDMGYGDLGIYGNEEVHSPNIDKLAEEGQCHLVKKNHWDTN